MSEPKNLWGGRFTGVADPGFVEFNRSFGFDRRLFEADVKGSLAHAGGLLAAGVLSDEEGAAIKSGLRKILESGRSDSAYFNSPAEDVHSFVEARLIELVGDVGRKLHTGRSRNDQVATDLRLWLRDAIDELQGRLKVAQTALLDLAESRRDVVIPGYTHLQKAQPVLFAHWCLAYFEMLSRDRGRLDNACASVNVMPLGAAALAGTSYPIDREAVASELGFATIAKYSLDAVSDRDFCVEFTSVCAIVMVHLSRLAEDIIIYSTAEFGFFELSDAVATGSSLMPQKKNPDAMELVRGKAARVFGDNLQLLTMLKGLPLAYNKDMQEDKEAVFDAADTTSACLSVTATVLRNVRVNENVVSAASASGYMNATELADYLARKGMPFREAHELTGRIVLRAIELGVELQDLPIKVLQEFSSEVTDDVFEALSVERTIATKNQVGGTSPARVSEALAIARTELGS